MIDFSFNIFAALSKCQERDFFGLVPWYHYLPDSSFTPECNIRNFKVLGDNSDIPLILLAIVDDLLRIAGLVALAFIFVGAIRFMTSQGNPEDTAKAQQTVVNALIGLVLAVSAIAIVSFLGNKLG